MSAEMLRLELEKSHLQREFEREKRDWERKVNDMQELNKKVAFSGLTQHFLVFVTTCLTSVGFYKAGPI